MHLRPNRKKDKKQEDIANITWDVRGKVRTIERAQNAQASELEFLYDAMGQRVMKIERKPQSGNTREEVYTVYVRDAQGNVMAVYKGDRTIQGNPLVNLTTTEYRLEEHHLYGSSRLGMERYVDDTLYYGQTFSLLGNSTTTVTPVTPNNDFAETQVVGAKNLEMSNHLGNVLVVVSDMKRSVEGNPGQTSHYTADVISWSDYMPFGSQMEGRNGSEGNYRYGFNGMEKDDEVKGSGNHLDFGARCYDSRLGWFNSIDNFSSSFPFQAPYIISSNNPIINIDLNGDSSVVVISGTPIAWYRSYNGQRFPLYTITVYRDMSLRTYNRLRSTHSLPDPDYADYIARDANDVADKEGFVRHSDKRYGSNNETPPGEYFLFYKYVNDVFQLWVGDEDGIYSITGPDGVRTGVAIHNWDPMDAQGCFTFCSGADTQPIFELKGAIPDLLDPAEPVRLVVEEREAKPTSWEGVPNASEQINGSRFVGTMPNGNMELLPTVNSVDLMKRREELKNTN